MLSRRETLLSRKRIRINEGKWVARENQSSGFRDEHVGTFPPKKIGEEHKIVGLGEMGPPKGREGKREGKEMLYGDLLLRLTH